MEPIFEHSSKDPRWIQLKPSRLQLAFMLAGASVAVAVLVLTPEVSTRLRGLVVAAICLQIVWEIWRQFGGDAQMVTAFYFITLDPQLDRSGERDRRSNPNDDESGNQTKTKKNVKAPAKLGIRLQLKNTTIQQGEVKEGAFVMPWFANVPYQLPNDGWLRKIWPRTLSLWPDRLEVEAFRTVRVKLRWY